ncbi:MAG: winged helix DNA-binding domain-containing protein [Micropruina sp.]|uniref:winged helix DNA-binding domain-containing protein n=1 Tax=Micropruina sp. TaxID=2737536 RepID=UPI0039E4D675
MRFPDSARRARLARRHALHPDHRLDDPTQVARALGALHATEPPTVHLGVAARMHDPEVAVVERALYGERTLVKQLAMRRTLFAFPVEALPAVWGSASERVAVQQRAQLIRELERHGVTEDGARWVDRARAAVLDRLAGGVELSARQLREELPELHGLMRGAPGSRWGVADVHFAPRLLTLLGAEHSIVRATNDGHWRTSRPRWTRTDSWLDAVPEPLSPDAGYAALVRSWLAGFGPGTEADLVWWLGATKTAVRAALAAVEAVPVTLDSGATGYLLPGDDLVDEEPGRRWAALLPTLDPTVMGWRERDFYLAPELVPHLFDSNGNGGTTAWIDGRVVGCWVQDEHARVLVLPCAPLRTADRDLLEAEAERLTAFLDGVVISNIYKSRMMKGEPLP